MDESQRAVVSLTPPVGDRDHTLGPPDAAVTLVEYGDYECPYCGRAFPIVQQLREEMVERLRIVYRHFPQNTVHAHASVAAQAAEAAGAQGKFWQMHDLLFRHQDDLADADFVQYALRIGLEVYRFEADLSSEFYSRRVRDDYASGLRSGVHGTPTFFINGNRYEGALEYEVLRGALERAAATAVTPKTEGAP